MTQTALVCLNRRLRLRHTGHWQQPLRFLLYQNRTGWLSVPCLCVCNPVYPVQWCIWLRGCGFSKPHFNFLNLALERGHKQKQQSTAQPKTHSSRFINPNSEHCSTAEARMTPRELFVVTDWGFFSDYTTSIKATCSTTARLWAIMGSTMWEGWWADMPSSPPQLFILSPKEISTLWHSFTVIYRTSICDTFQELFCDDVEVGWSTILVQTEILPNIY